MGQSRGRGEIPAPAGGGGRPAYGRQAISRFSVTSPAPDACDQSARMATAMTRSSPRRRACSPRKGYSTASITAIRTGGGHSRRADYKYFTNKRDLLEHSIATDLYCASSPTSRQRSQRERISRIAYVLVSEALARAEGPGTLCVAVSSTARGLHCLIAVDQDPTGNGEALALSYAKASVDRACHQGQPSKTKRKLTCSANRPYCGWHRELVQAVST